MAAYRKLGRRDEGCQLLRGYLEQLPVARPARCGVPGRTGERRRRSRLHAGARRAAAQSDAARPRQAARGARCWWRRRSMRADLELVKNLIHGHTRRVARYRCDNCGFKARQFYWRCPACGGWETYPPQRTRRIRFDTVRKTAPMKITVIGTGYVRAWSSRHLSWPRSAMMCSASMSMPTRSASSTPAASPSTNPAWRPWWRATTPPAACASPPTSAEAVRHGDHPVHRRRHAAGRGRLRRSAVRGRRRAQHRPPHERLPGGRRQVHRAGRHRRQGARRHRRGTGERAAPTIDLQRRLQSGVPQGRRRGRGLHAPRPHRRRRRGRPRHRPDARSSTPPSSATTSA